MHPPDPEPVSTDPTRARVAEASLRLMANQVPRSVLADLKSRAEAEKDAYPWESIVATIVALPVDPEALVRLGLQAQRDWIARGGLERPRPGLRRKVKSAVAYLVARILIGALYVVAVLALLLVLRQKWPWLDVYEALRWLQRTLPGLFPPP